MPRILLAALTGLFLQATHAQAPVQAPEIQPGVGVPVALQVQRLAPQLVSFAGSQANFEALVNALALGGPVTITTVDASGLTQTATFTMPGSTLTSPTEIARALETVRQQLISSGVAVPTAQQLGAALTGTQVPVTVGTTTPTPGAASGIGLGGRAGAAAGGTLPSPAEQLQGRVPAPRVNTSDSRVLGNRSDTPVPATPAVAGPPPTPPAAEAPVPGRTIPRDR